MLNVILGVTAVLLCTYFGRKITARYKEIYDFISAFDEFNSALIRDVSFKKEGVIALMNQKYGNDDFNEYLQGVISAKKNHGDLPDLPQYVKGDDAFKISEYFSTVGTSYSAAETDLLRSTRDELGEKKKNYRELSQKYATLGSKLGFALGAALFIVII